MRMAGNPCHFLNAEDTAAIKQSLRETKKL
jgi:hypothetical protein